MEDILTCQNHEDVAVSHAETLVLPSVGEEMETRASLLTEASESRPDWSEAPGKVPAPVVLCKK